MPDETPRPNPPLSRDDAKRQIERTLQDGETVFSRHVHDDVASGRHGTTYQDILHVLEHGTILREAEWDERHENWKYKVEGRDLEDEDLRVITIIIEEHFRMFIVTAY